MVCRDAEHDEDIAGTVAATGGTDTGARTVTRRGASAPALPLTLPLPLVTSNARKAMASRQPLTPTAATWRCGVLGNGGVTLACSTTAP